MITELRLTHLHPASLMGVILVAVCSLSMFGKCLENKLQNI